jgi:hypothetical protein
MKIGTVERALQLAPECMSLEELRRRLKKEGYSLVDEHLAGSQIKAKLRNLLRG